MSTMTTTAWPALARTPRAPLAAGIARRIFEHALPMLEVRAVFPDGRVVGRGGASAPVMEVVRPAAFFARLGKDTNIGFGEAYMAGDWRPGPHTDLGDLLTPFAERLTTLVPAPLQRLRAIVDKRMPHRNTLIGAKENISAHYDLSNDLFEAFLDETMSYSSAWFGDESMSLADAQRRKIDAILDDVRVGPGSRVLEIGSGWGALAIRAGLRGAEVTSVTLSLEQCEDARRRIAAAGLADRVHIGVRDYREVVGQYDAVVSVEMIEAVGAEYWPTYFATLDRLLAPGGRIGLQTITMSHDRMLVTANSWSWVQKYIFPGGLIPSLQAIDEVCAEHTALHVSGRRDFGQDYARTLRLWRDRFNQQWDQINALGFDETFRRMWELYLAYSEAGFRTGYIGVSQLTLTR